MQIDNSILLDVEAYVTNFITEQVPKEYAYHNIDHTVSGSMILVMIKAQKTMKKEESLTPELFSKNTDMRNIN